MLNVSVRHSTKYNMNVFLSFVSAVKLKLTCGHMKSCTARRFHSTNMEVFVFRRIFDFTLLSRAWLHGLVLLWPRIPCVVQAAALGRAPFLLSDCWNKKETNRDYSVFCPYLIFKCSARECPAMHRAAWPAVSQRTGQLIMNHWRQMMKVNTSISKINWRIQSGR